MSTARELALRPGDHVSLAASIMQENVVEVNGKPRGELVSRGLDFGARTRVEVLAVNSFGAATVRYLEPSFERRVDGRGRLLTGRLDKPEGYVGQIWEGYAGFTKTD